MYVPIMSHFPDFMEIEIFILTDLINFIWHKLRILEKIHPLSNSVTTRTEVQLRGKTGAFNFKNVIFFFLLPITVIIWNMKISMLEQNSLISSIFYNHLDWGGQRGKNPNINDKKSSNALIVTLFGAITYTKFCQVSSVRSKIF